VLGVIWRALNLARRVSYIIGRCAAAQAARCCTADVRALCGRPHGRCFTLFSRVRRHDSRVADPARALEHQNAVLGDQAMWVCLRCRTGQARPPHAHVALAPCLQAGHGGPATGCDDVVQGKSYTAFVSELRRCEVRGMQACVVGSRVETGQAEGTRHRL